MLIKNPIIYIIYIIYIYSVDPDKMLQTYFVLTKSVDPDEMQGLHCQNTHLCVTDIQMVHCTFSVVQ